MKWTRAVHHLQALADSCGRAAAQPSAIFSLHVEQLWVFADALDAPAELDVVAVALGVDLPAADVAWQSTPQGAEHWANATGLAKAPVVAFWRSVHVPVWNHQIERPLLLWDVGSGVREAAMDALAAADLAAVEALREPAPATAELLARLESEQQVGLEVLRRASATYTEKRWSPGALSKIADPLAAAAAGCLDVLDAVGELGPKT